MKLLGTTDISHSSCNHEINIKRKLQKSYRLHLYTVTMFYLHKNKFLVPRMRI